jgi:hypothetical protein
MSLHPATKVTIYGSQSLRSAVGTVSVNGTKLGNINGQKSDNSDILHMQQLGSFDISNLQATANTITIAYNVDETKAVQNPTNPADRYFLGIDYIELDEPKTDDTKPGDDPNTGQCVDR